MILYQLAKWMEEHRRLKKIIRSTEGEVGLLVHRKAQVEQQMISQANLWLGQREATAALVAHSAAASIIEACEAVQQ